MKSRIAIFAVAASLLWAQSNPIYVPFAPSAVKGVLYKPDTGPAPRVAILIMHRTANFLTHLGATELSKRGFLVLAMNPRSDNNEAAVKWEDIALDVKSGVEYLRKQRGIAKVVLFGHSGGGPTMSFYQAVAEKGPAYCQGPNKLEGKGAYPDDDVFVIVRGQGARLMDIDPSIHHGTLRPQKLLKNDGTVVRQRIESVRRAGRPSPERNATFDGGEELLRLRAEVDHRQVQRRRDTGKVNTAVFTCPCRWNCTQIR